MDAAYVLSGSDDTNVRVWRAKANVSAAQPLPREKAKRDYQAALVEKHKYLPEIKRIKKHTHVPRAIMKAAQTKKTVHEGVIRREKNRRKHSAKGKVPKRSARESKVWNVQE